MTWRVVALDALPDEPWRNGGGRTRTIAAQQRAGGEPPWDWRISVATIERSAAFSAFPGADRASVLLGTGHIKLSADGEETVEMHQPGDLAVYRGEAPWHAELHRVGPPLLLLNVMTRRGAVRARVQALRKDAALSGQMLAVVVVDGVWRVTDTPSGEALTLSAGCCAVLDNAPRRSMTGCRIEHVSNPGWLAAVSIELD